MDLTQFKKARDALNEEICFINFQLMIASYDAAEQEGTMSEEQENQYLAQRKILTEKIRLNRERVNNVIDNASEWLLKEMTYHHKLLSLQNGLSWQTDETKKALPLSLLNPSPLSRNEVWSISDLKEQQLQAEERSRRVLEFTTQFWRLWVDINRSHRLMDQPHFKEQINIIFQTIDDRKPCCLCNVNHQDMAILRDDLHKPMLCFEPKTSLCRCINRLYDACSSCLLSVVREEYLAMLELFFEGKRAHMNASCLFCCETCKGMFCIYQLLHLPSRKNIEREKLTVVEEKKLPMAQIMQTVNDALLLYAKKELKRSHDHKHN